MNQMNHDSEGGAAAYQARSKLDVPVGNGGLSLRRVSVMLSLVAAHQWDGSTPEDVWFSALLQSKNGTDAQRALPGRLSTMTEVSNHGNAVIESTLLEVGGASVSLDSLGPIIINSDGTTRRITNWGELDDRERAVSSG